MDSGLKFRFRCFLLVGVKFLWVFLNITFICIVIFRLHYFYPNVLTWLLLKHLFFLTYQSKPQKHSIFVLSPSQLKLIYKLRTFNCSLPFTYSVFTLFTPFLTLIVNPTTRHSRGLLIIFMCMAGFKTSFCTFFCVFYYVCRFWSNVSFLLVYMSRISQNLFW